MTPCPDPDKGHSPEWHSGPTQSLQFSGISGPKDPDPGVLRIQLLRKEVKKMEKKKIVSLVEVLVIIALLATPSMAVVNPPKNPGGKPFSDIWNALVDLQTQIFQIQSTPEPLKVITGRFEGLVTIVPVPAGYTKTQCTCNAAIDAVPPYMDMSVYLQGFRVVVDPSHNGEWRITSKGYFMGPIDPTSMDDSQGWYIVICQK
jgi:hypothetical protein